MIILLESYLTLWRKLYSSGTLARFWRCSLLRGKSVLKCCGKVIKFRKQNWNSHCLRRICTKFARNQLFYALELLRWSETWGTEENSMSSASFTFHVHIVSYFSGCSYMTSTVSLKFLYLLHSLTVSFIISQYVHHCLFTFVKELHPS